MNDGIKLLKKKLLDMYGGTGQMYIPSVDTVVIPVRDSLIKREFDGSNYIELSRKWNLTERYIRDIVKAEAKQLRLKPMDGQMSLL